MSYDLSLGGGGQLGGASVGEKNNSYCDLGWTYQGQGTALCGGSRNWGAMNLEAWRPL